MNYSNDKNKNSVKIRLYDAQNLDNIPQLQKFPLAYRQKIKAVSQVLPFRSNNYVVDELIDWDNIPDDPIFRLTFPHPEMLPSEDLNQMVQLVDGGASRQVLRERANQIRHHLNPNPSGQKHNVPTFKNEPVPGIQHKYDQTVLLFPSQGQHCQAYCSYCFRWPQIVGMEELKFVTRESGIFQEYLRHHQEVTDVLITGGDPMTMKAWQLKLYIEPLLGEGFEHIRTIRIGTKSIAYWPYRFVTDEDADEVLRLFELVVRSGKHLALMGHFTHPREMETSIAQEAISRIRSTGTQIRCQTPIVRHINDSSKALAQMWQMQVKLGCIPYYLFVERPTGARHYFEMPLMRAWKIYQNAIGQVSGLGRTVRGPVMSCSPGKVLIQGVANAGGEEVFVLSFLQGRNSKWCNRPFFAQFDPKATWFDDLVPAFGKQEFFFNQTISPVPSLNLAA